MDPWLFRGAQGSSRTHWDQEIRYKSLGHLVVRWLCGIWWWSSSLAASSMAKEGGMSSFMDKDHVRIVS